MSGSLANYGDTREEQGRWILHSEPEEIPTRLRFASSAEPPKIQT